MAFAVGPKGLSPKPYFQPKKEKLEEWISILTFNNQY